MNRTYEVLFILRPDLVDEEADKLVAGLESGATSTGIAFRKVERLGRRRLAYRVRGFREGNYVLFDMEAGAEPIGELQRRLRISEPVIKFLAVRTDELDKRLDKVRRHREERLKRRPAPASAPEAVSPEAELAARHESANPAEEHRHE
ncbi:MAG TPA: 30S ribosomal protein S6 [Terriglobales bacterium]|nr:30S ribosomal protein S6 [Terriglobales bacterium]